MKRRLQRAWAFGRHIPPSKLVRRAFLILKRRQSDRRGPHTLPPPQAKLGPALPAALLPPRCRGQVRREGPDWVFCFLGRKLRFAGGLIDWMAPGAGSEHQLWRMNLHYMEYLEEADDVDFAALVTSWLESNEELRPGAWRDGWNAYALSIRIVVWLQQIGTRTDRLDANLVARMEDSLARQTAYLSHNLETDIGGNHLIKNIKALLWAGAAFEGQAAREWRALGRRLLLDELKVQILSDGMHYERSPSYHAQVFADLLECRAVLDGPFLELDDALVRMAQVVADLTHPDGFAAQFNDAGLRMAYEPATCLAAFAAQTGTTPQPKRRFAYPDAGYFGYRDDRLTVIIDCGALAPDDLPAHGHGDMLSFELSLDGQRVIVDRGVYEYIPGPLRNAARAASSHNTLAIDGADQADFFGAFRFGRRARFIDCQWQETSERARLTGAHDGYAILPGAPIHRRTFDIGPDGLTLRDHLEGPHETPAARITLLLHPQITAQPAPEGAWQLTGTQGQTARIVCSEPLILEETVWWPDMGQEIATTRLTASADVGWTEIETRIEVLPV